MNTESISYQTIKNLAAQLKSKVTDLLALAPQNDPFYVGTPTDTAQAQWFADLWRRTGYRPGVHLRRIHYWAVSQNPPIAMHNGQPYENTESCWDYLGKASARARYLGLVQISDIGDNKNPKPNVNADYYQWGNDPGFQVNMPDLSNPDVWISGIYDVNTQPYHLEIWCEKSTMNDVLLPVCRRFNANLVTFEGEVSITACYQLMKRIEASGGKPARIWYLSDFDPAGQSMPVAMSRKIEYMLMHYNKPFDIKVKTFLLTAKQVKHYKLPRTPIKETEKRAAKFESTYGTGAVELDALEALYPGELLKIVSSELAKYYSSAAKQAVKQAETAARQAVSAEVQAILDEYQDEIDALHSMINEIKSLQVDLTPYRVERFSPHVAESDKDWLFASERPYLQQINAYNHHKTNGKA